MSKKIGLFWLRDDFRITKNYGLAEATKNHDQVSVFYLYKESWTSSSFLLVQKIYLQKPRSSKMVAE